MKKVVLSLAGVVAAAAFAPQASALPLFARQTGMACSACHFNHFPMLNAFGRSFKASGFTLMGAEGKVEGDNLSIPATLNAAILTTAGYTRTNMSNTRAGIGLNGNGNGFFVPGTNGEFSLFVGGRVSDFAGALAELGFVGAGTLNQAKIPMLWDIGNGTRVGVVPFTTNSAGAAYSFELLNTGAVATHTMEFVAGDSNGSIASTLSAQQYIGTNTFATGAALVANNDMGFINFAKFNMLGPIDLRGTAGNFNVINGTTSTQTSTPNAGASLGSNYLRIAGTFDLAGWDSAVGIQHWGGASYNTGAYNTTNTGYYDTRASSIDGQMQGQLSGMPVGFYASYSRAPVVTAVTGGTLGNIFNNAGTATGTRSSFNLTAEVGVIPEKATLDAGIRRGKSGTNTGTPTVAGANNSDNAWLVGASYKLAQNMLLNLTYTSQSGDFWNATNSNSLGSKQTSFSLSTIF